MRAVVFHVAGYVWLEDARMPQIKEPTRSPA